MTTVGAGIPPELERDRLRSLKQLELIDTPREERFERLTRMARHVFGVPMSSVSLIDQDRQWFKSIQGLPLSEVPRERTVCQTTIARSYDHAEDPALVLEDAAADPDFAWIPGIGGDGGIRFYAGYPLYGPGGHPVGTFCLYDTVPRTLDADQVAAFSELAAMVQRELQWADDLERAAAIQRQLLPRPLSGIDGVDVAAVCIPAFVVGGDFYDHYPIRGGLVVTVADVMQGDGRGHRRRGRAVGLPGRVPTVRTDRLRRFRRSRRRDGDHRCGRASLGGSRGHRNLRDGVSCCSRL